MRNTLKASAMVGAFLAVVAVICMGQSRVDQYISWLRVDRIKGPQSTSTIYFDNPVAFASGSSLEVNGDIVLANDETIDNAADSKVRITYDDDSANLGYLLLTSDNAHGSMADNDLFEITAQADNDSDEVIDYGTIQFKLIDVTTNTEDAAFVFQVQCSGAEATVLTLGCDASGNKVATFAANTTISGGAADFNSVTVDAGAGIDCQAAGALQIGISTATSVDIGGAGEMTTVKGTLNVDEAVTLDTTLAVAGTLDVNGATTVTNITVDPNATVTLNTNTINAIGSTVTITDSVLTGGGTAILTNSLVEGCAIGTSVQAAAKVTTLDASGALTCTNVTVDPSAIVTMNTNTINAIGSTIDITDAVVTGGGTAIVTNMASVWATAYYVGTTAGWTGCVTNFGNGQTNYTYFLNGIVTNNVYEGP